MEAAREGNRVVRDELTVSPVRIGRFPLFTNTHYRWVAQLWSTEECWFHAPTGAAQTEDSNTADCFRDRPSAVTREGGSLSRFLRSRHWIPSQLHWPTRERRKESFSERSVQPVASSRSRSFPIVASGRETAGPSEIVGCGAPHADQRASAVRPRCFSASQQ